jgi:hypothetical protein
MDDFPQTEREMIEAAETYMRPPDEPYGRDEPPEAVIWAPKFAEARNYLLDAAAALTEDDLDPEDALRCAREAIGRIERLIDGD